MISIFIPAFNEEKNLPKVITNILKSQKGAGNIPIEIIIVNDASTDNTAKVISKLEKKHSFIRSIHHRTNQGIGAGFKNALKIARFNKFMIAPGDDDAAQKLIQDLFKHHQKAEIIFTYYLNKEMRGKKRNIISTLYGLIYMNVFDVYIQYINCMAMYPTRKLRQIDIHAKRFSITAEVNIKLLRRGCTFYEIPGYMQTGLEQSTSIGLKNLWEIVLTFVHLVYEIGYSKKKFYSYKPTRIMD